MTTSSRRFLGDDAEDLAALVVRGTAESYGRPSAAASRPQLWQPI
ncbi:hypothetical protein ACFYWY_34610 [Streptomyces sp. NPDC002870]